MSDRRGRSAPVAPTDSEERRQDRTAEPDPVIVLIEQWLADTSGYDEEAWPELQEALDQDRLSFRKLFHG